MGRDRQDSGPGFKTISLSSEERARAGVRPRSVPGSAIPAVGLRSPFSSLSVRFMSVRLPVCPAHRPAGRLGGIKGLVLTESGRTQSPQPTFPRVSGPCRVEIDLGRDRNPPNDTAPSPPPQHEESTGNPRSWVPVPALPLPGWVT